LRKAYQSFAKTTDRPTLVILRSHIAWGSPNKIDTHEAHGAPLGEDEIRLTKEAYGWPADEKFLVPDDVRTHFQQGIGARGKQAFDAWQKSFAEYASKHPDLAQQWQQMERGELPEGWDADIPEFPADDKGVASRTSSGKVLNTIAARVPWLIGG